MAFDKNSIVQGRLDLLVEDLSGEETSLLDRVFPREETDRHKYTVDVMPATGLPTQKGKLADGDASRPRKAKLASVSGMIDGRYEGSYVFTEAERRELEANNIQLERYARAAQADASYNIDTDLHQALINTTYFQNHTRSGADYTNPSAPLVKDVLDLAKKLGNNKGDLIVIMGQDVADANRFNHDILARTSNYAAGMAQDEELRSAFRGMGFRDAIIAGSLGKAESDGIDSVTLSYNFDGLFWIGRPDSIVNVELGQAGGEINYLPQSKEWLLDYFRFIDIRHTLESKFGGGFIVSPLG